MVWFHCEDCGDTIKKPKLVSHYRNCSASQFSCVDCLQTFTKATVNGHTTCVTEHEKYALAATKPGGFAAGGLQTNREGGPAAGVPSEPTGLEFLSTRPPWKCSVCNVNCTSRETLVNHAAGAKHKRRARAALAAANGGNKADGGNGFAANGGGASSGAGGAGAPAANGAKAGKRRMSPSSSSSSSSDSSSSDDEEAENKGPLAKRQARGAGVTLKGNGVPAKRSSSTSSSDSDSSDESSSDSDSDSDAPAAKKHKAEAATKRPGRPSESSSSSSEDDSDSDDIPSMRAAGQKAGFAAGSAGKPAQVKEAGNAMAALPPVAAQKKQFSAPATSDSTSSPSSSTSEESNTSDDSDSGPNSQGKQVSAKALAKPHSDAAATARASKKGGAGQLRRNLFGSEEGTGGGKELSRSSSGSDESSDSDSEGQPQDLGKRAGIRTAAPGSALAQKACAPSIKKQLSSSSDSSSDDDSDSDTSSSDDDRDDSNGGKSAAGEGQVTGKSVQVKTVAATPVLAAAANGAMAKKHPAPNPGSSSSSDSDDSSSDDSSDSDAAKVRSQEPKTDSLHLSLQDAKKFARLTTAVKEALERKAKVGRGVLLRLVRMHLLEGSELEVTDVELRKVRQQLVAKGVCDVSTRHV